MTLAINIVLIIMIGIRSIIGIQLVISARKSNMKNLYILALYYLVGSFGLPFKLDFMDSQFILMFFLNFAQLILLIFIHQTFYVQKKSPLLIIFIISFLTSVVSVFILGLYILDPTIGENLPYIAQVIGAVAGIVTFGWLVTIAWKSYSRIAPSTTIEDWLKMKYKLIILYSIIIIIPLCFYFIPDSTAQGSPLIIPMGILAIFGWIVQYFTWVMPEKLVQYFNRNYTGETTLDQLPSEDEIMKLLG